MALSSKSLGLTGRRGRPPAERVIPLYHQVYLHLLDLLEGKPPPDRPLPSEPALAARFGVSRVTLRNTLSRLESEGRLRRVRGVGTFPVPQEASSARTNIKGQLESLISLEGLTTVKNLDWRDAAADEAPAALGAGRCRRLARLRSFEGRPISLTTIFLPESYARRIAWPPTGDAPVIRLLEQDGVIATQVEQTLTAVAADALAAGALGVAEGAPLIAMRRLMLDADRRPVLHQESLYVPERFEYRMTLTRTELGSIAKWTPIG